VTNIDVSTDELVAELAHRLRTPEPLIRTRVGLPNRAATTPPSRPEPPNYAEDGWSWAGNDS
jgi:hypothetical protein